jgi:frataxin-like iron-binding protein CyaY
LVRRLIDERFTEIYGRLKEEVDRRFVALEERLAQRNIDEKAIRSLVKAMVGSEVARVHSVVMEEFDRLKAKVEEELSKRGVDAETIRQVVNEEFSRVINELDRRFMHVLSAIDEQANDIRDAMDLINEVLKIVIEDEERVAEIKNMLSEEKIEELLYKALIKHGVIKRRRRKWAPLIAGLSVLAAIIVGLVVNPIITLVILFVAIAVLLRW